MVLLRMLYVVCFNQNDYEQTHRGLCAKVTFVSHPLPHHKTCVQLQMLLDSCLLHVVQPEVLQCSMETGYKHLQGINDLMTHTGLYNYRHVITFVRTKHRHVFGCSQAFLQS